MLVALCLGLKHRTKYLSLVMRKECTTICVDSMATFYWKYFRSMVTLVGAICNKKDCNAEYCYVQVRFQNGYLLLESFR
jgi:hypothetical protein